MNIKYIRITNFSLSKIAILLLGFFLAFTAFFPGFMSADSLGQYAMSKSLVLNDWHPPIMSWLWSILNLYFRGPEGLLFFHLIIFAIALYIWQKRFQEKKYSWLILCIGFLPWIINFSGVLWKDVGMAFSLLLLTGIGVTKRTPAKILLASLLLFYAINLRYNAIFAAAPITILIISQWFPNLTKTKIIVLTTATLLTTIVLGDLFSHKILQATRGYSYKYMLIDDLSYLSLKEKISLIPGASFATIKDCATSEANGSMLIGKVYCLSQKPKHPSANNIENTPNNQPSSSLEHTWLIHVLKNPLDYVYYRLSAFSYLLRSPTDYAFFFWQKGIGENEFGITQEKNGATILVQALTLGTAHLAPFLFKPYWWLWISTLFLLYTFASKQNSSTRIVQGLLASSILYIIGYIPITPSADFRYIYWSVIATTLAGILLIIDRPILLKNALRKKIVLAGIALVTTLILFNMQKIFAIEMDKVVMESTATATMQKQIL